MQNADNFYGISRLLAIKNDMPSGREFAVPGTDLVTPLTLVRILRQGMERTVQQSKVMTTLFTPPTFLRITTNLAKILKCLFG